MCFTSGSAFYTSSGIFHLPLNKIITHTQFSINAITVSLSSLVLLNFCTYLWCSVKVTRTSKNEQIFTDTYSYFGTSLVYIGFILMHWWPILRLYIWFWFIISTAEFSKWTEGNGLFSHVVTYGYLKTQ